MSCFTLSNPIIYELTNSKLNLISRSPASIIRIFNCFVLNFCTRKFDFFYLIDCVVFYNFIREVIRIVKMFLAMTERINHKKIIVLDKLYRIRSFVVRAWMNHIHLWDDKIFSSISMWFIIITHETCQIKRENEIRNLFDIFRHLYINVKHFSLTNLINRMR